MDRHTLRGSGSAEEGQKLSIPISRFYASLDAYDLKLTVVGGLLRRRGGARVRGGYDA